MLKTSVTAAAVAGTLFLAGIEPVLGFVAGLTVIYLSIKLDCPKPSK